ncbi:MAG: rhodanese-like domain-containing protein [Mariprofundaceae bacterium]|nr:rhodanese-like domain-containing protein [Mariprofundaceae bacterium]
MRKISYLSLFVAALFLAVNVSACGMGEQANGYENSGVKHAHTHWHAGDRSPIPFMFLDVRTPEEYSDGHIQGAVLIPVQELEKRLAEVPKDKRVYVYCHSGRRSVTASNMLVEGGVSNIENVEGGIVAWKKAGYPVVK